MNNDLLLPLAGFVFIVLAARQVGLFLTRFNFPLISGYLLAGIVVGYRRGRENAAGGFRVRGGGLAGRDVEHADD